MDGSIQIADNTRIGRVIAVSAAQVIVLLESSATPSGPATHRNGCADQAADPRLDRLWNGHGARVPLPSLSVPDDDLKIIEIELLGEMLREATGSHSIFSAACRSSLDRSACLPGNAGRPCPVYAPSGMASVPVARSTKLAVCGLPSYRRPGQAFQHCRDDRLG